MAAFEETLLDTSGIPVPPDLVNISYNDAGSKFISRASRRTFAQPTERPFG
jgi:hypothetical protein